MRSNLKLRPISQFCSLVVVPKVLGEAGWIFDPDESGAL